MSIFEESFALAYKEYLKEEEAKFEQNLDDTMKELTEASQSVNNSLAILAEFYNNYDRIAIYEAQGEAAVGTTVSNKDDKNENKDDKNKNNEDKEKKENAIQDMTSSLTNLIKTYNNTIFNKIYGKDDSDEYIPRPVEIVTPISQMKFPQNIIFFITTIIKWIKNVIIYFIGKFTNLIRRLIGETPKVMNKDFIKLNFEKVKKIENTNDIKKAIIGDAAIRLIKTENPNLLEGLFDGVFMPPKETPVQKQSYVVSIDLSKDIFHLKELVQHFYNLFDNAYGSNNEKLFETEDLELVLQVFQKTLKEVKNGDISRYSINGNAVEFEPINMEKVRENYNVTATNVLSLKEAYQSTSNKIKEISKIINSKEILAMSDLGMSYTTLSSATYSQMADIYKTTLERIKDAKELERKMTKVQKKYDALVSELSKLQKFSMTLSNISYDVVYNRRMQLLLASSKYMTNVVSLRLTALALYIKELKDIQEMIKMLTMINSQGRN